MSEVSEGSLIVSRGGRPRKFDEPSYPVSSRVPESDADALMQLASYSGESVSGYIRGLIQKAVRANQRARFGIEKP